MLTHEQKKEIRELGIISPGRTGMLISEVTGDTIGYDYGERVEIDYLPESGADQHQVSLALELRQYCVDQGIPISDETPLSELRANLQKKQDTLTKLMGAIDDMTIAEGLPSEQ